MPNKTISVLIPVPVAKLAVYEMVNEWLSIFLVLCNMCTAQNTHSVLLHRRCVVPCAADLSLIKALARLPTVK